MRKVFYLLLSLCLIFILAACTNTEKNKEATTAVSTEIKLTERYLLIPTEGLWTYSEDINYEPIKSECIIPGFVSDYDSWKSEYWFVAIDNIVYVISNNNIEKLCNGRYLLIDGNYISVTGSTIQTFYLPEWFN